MLKRIAICLLVIGLIWLAVFAYFIVRISTYSLADDVRADGIVVLTGGGGRVEYGLDLLRHDRGKALFISGVSKGVVLGDLLEKAPMGIREILGVVTLGRITLGHDAVNTIGNAEETAEWVRKREYKSLLIVTADYHMPRSLVEFRAKLKGVQLIAAPVDTGNYINVSWFDDEQKRNLILSEYHKWIASHARQWFIKSSNVQ